LHFIFFTLNIELVDEDMIIVPIILTDQQNGHIGFKEVREYIGLFFLHNKEIYLSLHYILLYNLLLKIGQMNGGTRFHSESIKLMCYELMLINKEHFLYYCNTMIAIVCLSFGEINMLYLYYHYVWNILFLLVFNLDKSKMMG
ncbi:hypothetical protein ACJX0J_019227, partial [Zea mays]